MTRVALVGANGHGKWHRRAIARLREAGRAELAGVCDVAPVRDEPDAPLPSATPVFRDHHELLTETRPEVVVVCTPPHTHLEIATDAVRAGADVLLEKPPFLSLAEHDAFARVLGETRRVCQVGFQALGSAALAELTDAVTAGALGRVTAVSSVGAWQRPDSYYERAPWAGRRSMNGRPVLDGALANPFAHSIMQCFAIAETVSGAPVVPRHIELERYRARPIEVDDTGVLRLQPADGITVVVAVTLCADENIEPQVLVHGDRGTAVLEYTNDRLELPGDRARRDVPGRVGLLENLLDHRAAPQSVPLLAALERTAPFTAAVEAITAAPPPAAVDARYVRTDGHGPDRVVTVPGVSAAMRKSAERLALPSEFGTPWATGMAATTMQTDADPSTA